MREWLGRLTAVLRRHRTLDATHQELQFHFDMEVEAGLRQGLSRDQALRRARLRAGRVSHAVEAARKDRRRRWLDGAALDFRHAVRALTRNPAFGTVAIVVLAASVAINTIIFFMLEGVVLRPLPYRDPDRLVRLYNTSQRTPKFPMSIGHYLDFREHARTLEGLALYTARDVELSGGESRSQRLTGVAVTSEYFSVLGRAPLLGRAFIEADLRSEIRHAILGHRLWRDRFGSDTAVIGRTIRLNREPWTIVGVAPEGFQHIGGDYRSPLQGESVDIWLPLPLNVSEGEMRFAHYCNAVGRVRQGFTESQSRQELESLAAAYTQRYPDAGRWSIRMEALLNEVTGRSRDVVWLLSAAGALVLLIACANIAGLCVARAVAAQKEQSVRRALGASRWQLVRVRLAENTLIGLIGAALGLLLAGFGIPLLRQLLPADFPRAHEIGLTIGSAVFAVAVALPTVLVAGLFTPGKSHAHVVQTRMTTGRQSRRLRSALVVGEIALAGLLCAGALFLLRSYMEIGARDHGFEPSGTLTFQISVPRSAAAQPGDVARRYEDIRERIGAIPGVVSVGASTNLPWSGYDENSGFLVVGRAQDPNRSSGSRYQAASPGYFEATGMKLVDGRFLDAALDRMGQPLTIVINDALAEREFPNGGAIGAKVRVFGAERQIVGVVGGIRDYPADPDVKPAFWLPLGQVEFRTVFFAARSATSDPASLTSAVTAAVHAVDPELALADIFTLDTRAERALAARRFALSLFQAFAALALVLSAAGIYGLLAYIVRQRRKELGIRIALGASRADLSAMILGDGLKMAALGAACCLLLIPLGGSLLRTFLYNVRPLDLVTVAGAPAALLIVSLLASLGPAWSAMRSDPCLALRDDT